MHGGLVDDEGLDYDELRHGPTDRSESELRTVPLLTKRDGFFWIELIVRP